MLNTDIHSLHVKHKMTKENFVRANNLINNGENLQREFLEKIYDDICSKELVIRKD